MEVVICLVASTACVFAFVVESEIYWWVCRRRFAKRVGEVLAQADADQRRYETNTGVYR